MAHTHILLRAVQKLADPHVHWKKKEVNFHFSSFQHFFVFSGILFRLFSFSVAINLKQYEATIIFGHSAFSIQVSKDMLLKHEPVFPFLWSFLYFSSLQCVLHLESLLVIIISIKAVDKTDGRGKNTGYHFNNDRCETALSGCCISHLSFVVID